MFCPQTHPTWGKNRGVSSFAPRSPRYLERADTSEDLSAIADKIGTLDDVRNDVALVYTQRGPIVISIFTYENEDKSWTPENKAEMLIGRLAHTIVDTWSPEGLAAKVTDPLAMPIAKIGR